MGPDAKLGSGKIFIRGGTPRLRVGGRGEQGAVGPRRQALKKTSLREGWGRKEIWKGGAAPPLGVLGVRTSHRGRGGSRSRRQGGGGPGGTFEGRVRRRFRRPDAGAPPGNPPVLRGGPGHGVVLGQTTPAKKVRTRAPGEKHCATRQSPRGFFFQTWFYWAGHP